MRLCMVLTAELGSAASETLWHDVGELMNALMVGRARNCLAGLWTLQALDPEARPPFLLNLTNRHLPGSQRSGHVQHERKGSWLILDLKHLLGTLLQNHKASMLVLLLLDPELHAFNVECLWRLHVSARCTASMPQELVSTIIVWK